MQRGNREVRAVLGTDVKMLRHFVHAALDRDPKVGTGSGLAQRPAWGVNRRCSAVEIRAAPRTTYPNLHCSGFGWLNMTSPNIASKPQHEMSRMEARYIAFTSKQF
jgi:hypothetical protein